MHIELGHGTPQLPSDTGPAAACLATAPSGLTSQAAPWAVSFTSLVALWGRDGRPLLCVGCTLVASDRPRQQLPALVARGCTRRGAGPCASRGTRSPRFSPRGTTALVTCTPRGGSQTIPPREAEPLGQWPPRAPHGTDACLTAAPAAPDAREASACSALSPGGLQGPAGLADAEDWPACVVGAQDQFRLKPLDSMAASRSRSSSFSRSRCSSSRATRASLCSTTSSISFRILFSSDSSSSVFRWSGRGRGRQACGAGGHGPLPSLPGAAHPRASYLPRPSAPGAPAAAGSACPPAPAPGHWGGGQAAVTWGPCLLTPSQAGAVLLPREAPSSPSTPMGPPHRRHSQDHQLRLVAHHGVLLLHQPEPLLHQPGVVLLAHACRGGRVRAAGGCPPGQQEAPHWGKCAKRAERDAAGTAQARSSLPAAPEGTPSLGPSGTCASRSSCPGLALTPQHLATRCRWPVPLSGFPPCALRAVSPFSLLICWTFVWHLYTLSLRTEAGVSLCTTLGLLSHCPCHPQLLLGAAPRGPAFLSP